MIDTLQPDAAARAKEDFASCLPLSSVQINNPDAVPLALWKTALSFLCYHNPMMVKANEEINWVVRSASLGN